MTKKQTTVVYFSVRSTARGTTPTVHNESDERGTFDTGYERGRSGATGGDVRANRAVPSGTSRPPPPLLSRFFG